MVRYSSVVNAMLMTPLPPARPTPQLDDATATSTYPDRPGRVHIRLAAPSCAAAVSPSQPPLPESPLAMPRPARPAPASPAGAYASLPPFARQPARWLSPQHGSSASTS